MATPERRPGTETLTKWSKRIDIGTAVFGYIIGGPIGMQLIIFSGATYIAADIIEKRKKASGG